MLTMEVVNCCDTYFSYPEAILLAVFSALFGLKEICRKGTADKWVFSQFLSRGKVIVKTKCMVWERLDDPGRFQSYEECVSG